MPLILQINYNEYLGMLGEILVEKKAVESGEAEHRFESIPEYQQHIFNELVNLANIPPIIVDAIKNEADLLDI